MGLTMAALIHSMEAHTRLMLHIEKIKNLNQNFGYIQLHIKEDQKIFIVPAEHGRAGGQKHEHPLYQHTKKSKRINIKVYFTQSITK